MQHPMSARATTTLMATNASSHGPAKDVKLGVLFGFTEPVESITGTMARGVERAMQEAAESGTLLGGATVVLMHGDTG